MATIGYMADGTEREEGERKTKKWEIGIGVRLKGEKDTKREKDGKGKGENDEKGKKGKRGKNKV